MAWEWVAPVSAASSAVIVGVTSILASRSMARSNAQHAEKMAGQERQQKRLEEAYIETLMLVEKTGHWATQIRQPLTRRTPEQLQEWAPLPPANEQIKVRVLVQAHGSEKVNELVNAYFSQIREIEHADKQIGRGLQSDKPREAARADDLWGRLEDQLRPAEREKREEIARQIAAELNPDREGPAES